MHAGKHPATYRPLLVAAAVLSFSRPRSSTSLVSPEQPPRSVLGLWVSFFCPPCCLLIVYGIPADRQRASAGDQGTWHTGRGRGKKFGLRAGPQFRTKTPTFDPPPPPSSIFCRVHGSLALVGPGLSMGSSSTGSLWLAAQYVPPSPFGTPCPYLCFEAAGPLARRTEKRERERGKQWREKNTAGCMISTKPNNSDAFSLSWARLPVQQQASHGVPATTGRPRLGPASTRLLLGERRERRSPRHFCLARERPAGTTEIMRSSSSNHPQE